MEARSSALVEELDLAEVLPRSQLQGDHIGLIRPRQDDIHSAFRHDVERIAILPSVRIIAPASYWRGSDLVVAASS